ncbi:expressed unknown protein [Seminavis robusta]|uniref:Uncharacterized protein n=1 Tax=Seminavis robusta TaxID=568900 RepID=A0A9N8H2X6_9STRA|nr:expressed unknown protein [Seminavis robusta]|eukprot:Sro26_g017750.1 n/a (319) ;mRNA; r:117244-118200
MNRYSQDDDDEDYRSQQAYNPRYESERQFYARFAKFLGGLMVFVLIMFMLQWEHDSALFLVGMVVLLLALMYMIGSMVYTICVVNPRHNLANILTEEELGQMDHSTSHHEDDEIQDGEGVGRMAVFSFEETPPVVRACREDIRYLPGNAAKPTNGIYHIVYNCIFFGKSIRSESKLQLQFEAETKNHSGWEVRGIVVTGTNQGVSMQRPISEGFVNGRGEMYWTYVSHANESNAGGIYRGILNFRSNTMYEGEFKAGAAPTGRIVRMELVEEGSSFDMPTTTSAATSNNGHQQQNNDGWGSTDMDNVVEMVEFEKSVV